VSRKKPDKVFRVVLPDGTVCNVLARHPKGARSAAEAVLGRRVPPSAEVQQGFVTAKRLAALGPQRDRRA
jgi:hypothetical protein